MSSTARPQKWRLAAENAKADYWISASRTADRARRKGSRAQAGIDYGHEPDLRGRGLFFRARRAGRGVVPQLV